MVSKLAQQDYLKGFKFSELEEKINNLDGLINECDTGWMLEEVEDISGIIERSFYKETISLQEREQLNHALHEKIQDFKKECPSKIITTEKQKPTKKKKKR